MSAAPPPDLSTQEGRDAYRRELRTVAAPLRLAGLLVVLIGAGLAVATRATDWAFPVWIDTAIFTLLGLGWAILIAVIVLRYQHHRRRTAGR